MALAENIKAKREEKGLSQTELAEKIYVCRDTISKLEMGNRILGTEKMLMLAKALDTTVEELWYGTNSKGE